MFGFTSGKPSKKRAVSKSARARLYQEVLEAEGYRPEVDEDGDLLFKAEGLTYVLVVGDDHEYFYLVLPHIWEIEDPAERANAVRTAHDLTSQIKVAKIFCDKKGVHCSVEMFIRDPKDVQPVLSRLVMSLQLARMEFTKKMQG